MMNLPDDPFVLLRELGFRWHPGMGMYFHAGLGFRLNLWRAPSWRQKGERLFARMVIAGNVQENEEIGSPNESGHLALYLDKYGINVELSLRQARLNALLA